MGGAITAPKKALLGGVEEVDGGGHDGVGNDGGEDAVVGVGNADGAGVSNKVGGLFRKKEEVGEVEVGGGGVEPESRRERVAKRTGPAISEMARQAAKEMPSGPGAVFLEWAMAE